MFFICLSFSWQIKYLFVILLKWFLTLGQGEALNIDPTSFYSHLYSSLMSLSLLTTPSTIPLAMSSLHDMLIMRRKKVSKARVLAFTKRMGTICLQLGKSPFNSIHHIFLWPINHLRWSLSFQFYDIFFNPRPQLHINWCRQNMASCTLLQHSTHGLVPSLLPMTTTTSA